MMKKAERIQEALQKLLSPFGWQVGVHYSDDQRYTYSCTLDIRNPECEFSGASLALVFSLTEAELMCRPDGDIDYLPKRWAREVLLQAIDRIEVAHETLKPTELDWRPSEAIPEDYYAM